MDEARIKLVYSAHLDSESQIQQLCCMQEAMCNVIDFGRKAVVAIIKYKREQLENKAVEINRQIRRPLNKSDSYDGKANVVDV